jgi:hypothetical protein
MEGVRDIPGAADLGRQKGAGLRRKVGGENGRVPSVI